MQEILTEFTRSVIDAPEANEFRPHTWRLLISGLASTTKPELIAPHVVTIFDHLTGHGEPNNNWIMDYHLPRLLEKQYAPSKLLSVLPVATLQDAQEKKRRQALFNLNVLPRAGWDAAWNGDPIEGILSFIDAPNDPDALSFFVNVSRAIRCPRPPRHGHSPARDLPRRVCPPHDHRIRPRPAELAPALQQRYISTDSRKLAGGPTHPALRGHKIQLAC